MVPPPKPCITLAPINMGIFFAKAATNDPISNIKIPTKRQFFLPNATAILLFNNDKQAIGKRYPEVNQPILSNALKLFPTSLIIVVTIV